MIAALAGSQAPDIDTILKLKNNAVYIRNHRGFTHSIPAVLFWSVLIPGILFMFYPEANLLHLWLWTLLAVVLHVFVDILTRTARRYPPVFEKMDRSRFNQYL